MRRLRDRISGIPFETMNHSGMVPDQWPCRIQGPRDFGRLRGIMRVVKCAMLACAIVVGSLMPASGQPAPNDPVPPVVTRTQPVTPFGWYVIGSIGCAAVSPMIGTVILGRELTIGEVYHTTLGCMLGPVGWLLADALFPPAVTGTNTQIGKQQRKSGQVVRGRHFNIPPPGET